MYPPKPTPFSLRTLVATVLALVLVGVLPQRSQEIDSDAAPSFRHIKVEARLAFQLLDQSANLPARAIAAKSVSTFAPPSSFRLGFERRPQGTTRPGKSGRQDVLRRPTSLVGVVEFRI